MQEIVNLLTDIKQLLEKLVEQKRDKRNKTRSNLAYTSQFNEFWELYPSRSGDSKAEAFKAYLKAITLIDHYTIITKVIDYKTTKDVKDGFNKMASTWLNQRMWESKFIPYKETSFVFKGE